MSVGGLEPEERGRQIYQGGRGEGREEGHSAGRGGLFCFRVSASLEGGGGQPPLTLSPKNPRGQAARFSTFLRDLSRDVFLKNLALFSPTGGKKKKNTLSSVTMSHCLT
jgi:hypothetical protein